MAWALYRAGEFSEALNTIDEALSSGAADAQLFFQAGTIYQAANGNGKGSEYLRMAAEINISYATYRAWENGKDDNAGPTRDQADRELSRGVVRPPRGKTDGCDVAPSGRRRPTSHRYQGRGP